MPVTAHVDVQLLLLSMSSPRYKRLPTAEEHQQQELQEAYDHSDVILTPTQQADGVEMTLEDVKRFVEDGDSLMEVIGPSVSESL